MKLSLRWLMELSSLCSALQKLTRGWMWQTSACIHFRFLLMHSSYDALDARFAGEFATPTISKGYSDWLSTLHCPLEYSQSY